LRFVGPAKPIGFAWSLCSEFLRLLVLQSGFFAWKLFNKKF